MALQFKKKTFEREFAALQKALEELCGQVLSENRAQFLWARMESRVRRLGLADFAEYWAKLESLPKNHPEWQFVVNVLTVSKTSFFRESEHFKYMTKVFLPAHEKRGRRELRVLSAGCSTGEEAYTLAMILQEAVDDRYPFEIIATDIDSESLATARNAVYPRARIAEIPIEYRFNLAYGTGAIADWVKVSDSVQKRVNFQHQNLLVFPYPWQSHFDLVFCRNVLLYFEPQTIGVCLKAFERVSRPGATLFIGHSESLLSLESGWEFVQPGVYSKQSPATVQPPRLVPVPDVTGILTAPTDDYSSPAAGSPKRVLIVEDSRTTRAVLTKVFSQDPELEVVGSASNPIEAESLLSVLKPDVVTMDIMMPVMDGISFLKKLLPKYRVPVVMISSLSVEDGVHILRALELGAVDYIEKPLVKDLERLGPVICRKVREAASCKVRLPPDDGAKRPIPLRAPKVELDTKGVIVIGASTGGPEALGEILTQLPNEMPPILIVQHVPGEFSKSMARRFDEICPFPVREARPGEPLRPREALVAPGGLHLTLARKGSDLVVKLSPDPANDPHRPSIDRLFTSAAELAGRRAIGVLLTGMGTDGAEGLLRLRKAGAHTIAQDESSSVVFGMPKEAIRLGAAERIVALEKIPQLLLEWLERAAKE